MNFFKSMLSDDPEPENTDNYRKSSADYGPNQQQTERAAAEHTDSSSASSGEISGSNSGGGGGGLWIFGDLVKTLTTKSESVLETYRRDLKEFGSGLRKESDLFREVANRAVKDLPTSIEVGASAAIDGVLKSTADIISQGKDVLLKPSDINNSDNSESVQNSRVYNRFDSLINAIRTDARTYCDDPEDLDDYKKWKLGFMISDRESEIEKLIGDNGSVESIYKRVVPNKVDYASFWCRYFYRVHKVKQQEEIRAQFVRRSLIVDDEEELSWDVDDNDNDDEDHNNNKNMNNVPTVDQNNEQCDVADDNKNHNSDVVDVNMNNVPTIEQKHEQSDVAGDNKNKNSDVAVVNMNNVPTIEQKHEKCDVAGDNKNNKSDVAVVNMNNVPKIDQNHDYKNSVEELKLSGGGVSDYQEVESVPKIDENLDCNKNSGKDLQKDEDLEWDEIGDIGEDDEKHVVQGETAKKGELFKRLNIGKDDDDEDLSWDIEDDDEPVKTSSRK